MLDGLNVARRQCCSDFILTTVIENWQNNVHFPDQPFSWDWLFTFLPLARYTDNPDLFLANFFLSKCYLKVDTVTHWKPIGILLKGDELCLLLLPRADL